MAFDQLQLASHLSLFPSFNLRHSLLRTNSRSIHTQPHHQTRTPVRLHLWLSSHSSGNCNSKKLPQFLPNKKQRHRAVIFCLQLGFASPSVLLKMPASNLHFQLGPCRCRATRSTEKMSSTSCHFSCAQRRLKSLRLTQIRPRYAQTLFDT